MALRETPTVARTGLAQAGSEGREPIQETRLAFNPDLPLVTTHAQKPDSRLPRSDSHLPDSRWAAVL